MLPLKHLPVNWIDGMKITKEHLLQLQSYVAEGLRESVATGINDLNYGLLKTTKDGMRPVNVKITVDPAKIIRVTLIECHAVTSGGIRIEINPASTIKQSTETNKLTDEYDFSESKEKNFYAVVAVDIFANIPAGQPDAKETPPRFPFLTPKYTVSILPESQFNENSNAHYMLAIGKLQLSGGRMMVNEKYIPPCTTVSSHPMLLDSYYAVGNFLGESANLNTSIVQKIHAKSQASSLIKSFLMFSEKTNGFLANSLGSFRWSATEQPPVFFLEYFLRFAYVIKFCLDGLPQKDKEELMNYFSEWMEMSASEITGIISEMIKTEYNHNDIGLSLAKAEQFITMIHTLFTKLNSLDFIGKKKGERAFVQERDFEEQKQEEMQQKSPKKGFSFLAD